MPSIVYFLFVLGLSFANQEEPHCSKCDFEEKVLEKMVRMEFHMDRMKSEFSDMLQKLLEVKKVYEATINEVNTLQTDMEERVTALETHVNNTVRGRLAELHSLAENLKTPSISFRARLNGHTTATINQVLVFPIAQLNEGQAYDPSTGIFTVPVNGTYVFAVTLCPWNDKHVTYSVIVDRVLQNRVHTYGNEGHTCFSSDINLVLSVNQSVGVQVTYISPNTVYTIDGNESHRWNMFSGTLIHT